MTEGQAKLIDDLVAVLAADPRVRSAWLSGSLGRGAGDPWSDVDLVVEVDEADLAPCLADYQGPRPGLPELVLARGLYGRILTAVTVDWARFDLAFATPAEFARLDGAGLQPLLGDPSRRPASRPADTDPGAPARLALLIEEFLRVLGLADVMAGRQEWLLGQQGVGLLRQMLVDLMLEENGLGAPGARGGARRLNPFLDPDQRKLLEALVPPTAEREALLAAQAALAHLFLPRARALAERRGVPWPQALEDATRRHLRVTLDLAI